MRKFLARAYLLLLSLLMSLAWLVVGTIWLAAGTVGFAGELRELYRGARAQAMGNAYVGLADDEQAIFLNPAGLAGNRRYTLNYTALDLAASGDIVTSYQEGISAFKNLSGETLNVIIGKNIYADAQFAPSLLMPNLGVAILVDGQVALQSQNKALPQLTLGYQTTNGLQLAYGVTVGRGFRHQGELRLGVGAKVLWRRGGYRLVPMMTLVNLNKDTLGAMTGNFQRGFGVDLGSQYVHNFGKRMSLSGGLAFTDVGDTYFGNTAMPIKANLAGGIAFQYSLALTKVIATCDYRHILDRTDWRKKAHLGLEVGLPFIGLYGGVNQVNFSYGASFDFWLIRVTALSYSEEQGSFVHQNSMRRWVLKSALKFEL